MNAQAAAEIPDDVDGEAPKRQASPTLQDFIRATPDFPQDALIEAAGRPLTLDEIREQRISWVTGMMGGKMSEEQVKKLLAEQYG